jgi:hypothetical protein
MDRTTRTVRTLVPAPLARARCQQPRWRVSQETCRCGGVKTTGSNGSYRAELAHYTAQQCWHDAQAHTTTLSHGRIHERDAWQLLLKRAMNWSRRSGLRIAA